MLDDTSTWGLYSSGNTIYGAVNGTTVATGNNFSTSGTDFNFATRTATSGTYTGTAVTGATLTATGSNGVTFSGIFNASYNTPANIANIAGTYTGWGITKSTLAQTSIVTISNTGVVSASAINCTVAGTVTPRAGGKNVYNVSTTFSGSNCALGNGTTTTGVAVLDASSGASRLVAITLNSGKSDGYIFSGELSGGAGIATSVPVKLAYQNWGKAAHTQTFNLTSSNSCLGTYKSVKSDGTSQSELFESTIHPYSSSVSTISYSNCTPALTTTTSKEYYDINYLPFGNLITSASALNNGFYGVYASTPNIPVTVTVGDLGAVGTINKFTDSTKTVPAGREDVTYSVSAETTTSVLLDLTIKYYDASSVLSATEVDTLRVTTSGVATFLAAKITYANAVVVEFR